MIFGKFEPPEIPDTNSRSVIQIILDTFLTPTPPLVWHFSLSNHWFLGLKCSKISNELKKVSIEAFPCDKIPKSQSSKKAKKVCVTFLLTPPPFRMSRIIWMAPNKVQQGTTTLRKATPFWPITKLFLTSRTVNLFSGSIKSKRDLLGTRLHWHEMLLRLVQEMVAEIPGSKGNEQFYNQNWRKLDCFVW